MAGGPIIDSMGFPVGGGKPSQEQLQAMQAQQAVQLRMNMYASLIPVVAAKLLERDTLEDDMLADEDDRPLAKRIADESNEITLAALKVFPGLTFPNG